MSTRKIVASLLSVAAAAVPAVAFAGGGTPIQEAADAGLEIAVGLGAAGCAAGIVACCAGGMMRNGALMAGGATAAVCGGAWAGAPDVVQTVIGAAPGISLAALNIAPAIVPVLLALVGL